MSRHDDDQSIRGVSAVLGRYMVCSCCALLFGLALTFDVFLFCCYCYCVCGGVRVLYCRITIRRPGGVLPQRWLT
jgi:hypothetical protein